MSTPKSDRNAHPITLRSRIPNEAKGKNLLSFLVQRFRYLDREAWQEELAGGRIALNDVPANGKELLRGGMTLRYDKLHREPQVSLNYHIVHQDEALIAVDKPAHLPMHADGPFIRNTLIYRLREQLGEDLQLVHRLDRETSGICILAANKLAQAAVQAQFGAQHETPVRKTYLAVVHGRFEEAVRCERAIGHHPTSQVTLRRSAGDGAKEAKSAVTAFEPVRVGNHKSLVRCLPKTGRTHQIRVHLEHLGFPIVGDKLYGHPDGNYLAFVARMKAGDSVFKDTEAVPNRHLLHAHQIHLCHPSTEQQVCFEAPVPAEFDRWLSN